MMAEYYRLGSNKRLYRIFAPNAIIADGQMSWINRAIASHDPGLTRTVPPRGIKVYSAPPHSPIEGPAAPDLSITRGFSFIPQKRSATSQAVDAFNREATRSWPAYVARAGTRGAAVNTAFDLANNQAFAARSHVRSASPQDIRSASDRRVTASENDRRDQENRRDAADPAWRPGGSLLGNIRRSGAALLGAAAGNVLSDPATLLGPAGKFGAMALAQAVGLNVASRSGLAGLERREGIRERAYPGPPPAPPPHPGSAQRVITFGQQGDKIGVVHVNGRPGRIPDGAHETVAFETVLPRELYKRSHSVHNNRSNKAAEADILADPETLAYLDRMIPNALVAVSRKGGRRRPEGWVWHHGLQPGRMELIPEWQHVAKEFQKTLHPERRGGFAMHSIPAGAPRR